uniref:Putative secreted protein n=1 Tax=Anopheles darlingi TaxID=43151 RepID=A0A2M4DMX6_ANODA
MAWPLLLLLLPSAACDSFTSITVTKWLGGDRSVWGDDGGGPPPLLWLALRDRLPGPPSPSLPPSVAPWTLSEVDWVD